MKTSATAHILAGALIAAFAAGGCTDSAVTRVEAAAVLETTARTVVAPPSIAGDWVWTHRTVFVIPTEVAPAVIPPAAHPFLSGPVTRIECIVSGTMHLDQSGAEFDGDAAQESDCALKTGPRFSMPFVFQSPFEVSNGHITGRSFRFNVGPGCLNQGNLTVDGASVTAWRGSGECEIPIPVNPAVAKTIRWEAERG